MTNAQRNALMIAYVESTYGVKVELSDRAVNDNPAADRVGYDGNGTMLIWDRGDDATHQLIAHEAAHYVIGQGYEDDETGLPLTEFENYTLDEMDHRDAVELEDEVHAIEPGIYFNVFGFDAAVETYGELAHDDVDVEEMVEDAIEALRSNPVEAKARVAKIKAAPGKNLREKMANAGYRYDNWNPAGFKLRRAAYA